ncbi:MAG: DUF4126 domain-containing protein [Chloroflexi bacterium]|nr:MAG: DUF4126 domain-containing protein [Chloroflexota bacterium]
MAIARTIVIPAATRIRTDSGRSRLIPGEHRCRSACDSGVEALRPAAGGRIIGLVDPRLLALPAAFGLAGASGLNASLPLLLVSLLARAGLIHLGAPFDALQSDVAFYGILALAIIEFLGDKVPALDSVGHLVMAPVAAASGAIVFASQTGTVQHVEPGLTVVLSLLVGAGTAGAVHVTRAVARPVANVVLMGPAVSVVEDVSSAVLSLTALLAPLLVPLLVAAGAVAGWALWRRRTGRRRAPA